MAKQLTDQEEATIRSFKAESDGLQAEIDQAQSLIDKNKSTQKDIADKIKEIKGEDEAPAEEPPVPPVEPA